MKEKLSQIHATILISMIQLGVVVFSLPQLEALNFGTNGWLSIPICSVFVNLNIVLIALVYRLGQGRSILDILESAFPKVILYPVYFGMIAVWSMLACLVIKQYVLIFGMIAFPTTSPMVLKIVVDLLTIYLLGQGIYNISKASTLFLILMTWMLFVFLRQDFFGDTVYNGYLYLRRDGLIPH